MSKLRARVGIDLHSSQTCLKVDNFLVIQAIFFKEGIYLLAHRGRSMANATFLNCQLFDFDEDLPKPVNNCRRYF